MPNPAIISQKEAGRDTADRPEAPQTPRLFTFMPETAKAPLSVLLQEGSSAVAPRKLCISLSVVIASPAKSIQFSVLMDVVVALPPEVPGSKKSNKFQLVMLPVPSVEKLKDEKVAVVLSMPSLMSKDNRLLFCNAEWRWVPSGWFSPCGTVILSAVVRVSGGVAAPFVTAWVKGLPS